MTSSCVQCYVSMKGTVRSAAYGSPSNTPTYTQIQLTAMTLRYYYDSIDSIIYVVVLLVSSFANSYKNSDTPDSKVYSLNED